MLKNIIIVLLFSISTYSQNCASIFWTIDLQGDVKQWQLNSSSVSGGTVVFNNTFGRGIAYCGTDTDVTFFVSNSNSLKKYDPVLGWIEVLTGIDSYNNGGYGSRQYVMINSDLKYFDGTTLTTVANIPNITVADIAVDSFGRAWIFTGTYGPPTLTTALKVYNSTGLVATYPITAFNSTGTYGSFFLDNKLYILKGSGTFMTNPNTISSVAVNGNIGQLGTPIPFTCTNCHDAAACNTSLLALKEEDFNNAFIISPNPTKDFVKVFSQMDIKDLDIFSIDGKFIKSSTSNSIDLTGLTNGIYLLKITTKENYSYSKLIKKE